MISARESLQHLREGNGRFVADVRSRNTITSQPRRHELTSGQEPFSIILGCSDSRVPTEIVFDQGLGDCHPRGRKHRRRFASRQRRFRRGAVRRTVGSGSGTFPVRGYPRHPGRAATDHGKPVAESAFDCRPGPAVRGAVTGDSAQARCGRSGAARRSGQYRRLRKPSATWIRNSRGSDSARWPPRRRCRVFAWDRGCRFLR